jgi:predicted nucleic acid-binding protein
MIHLDTSFLIRALCPGSPQERQLLIWLDGPGSVSLSTVAWAEFLCGPVSAEVTAIARTLLGEPVPLGTAGAERAAQLFNDTGRRRGSLLDCLIAATAIEVGAQLATENPRDFERFKAAGLDLVS